MLYECDAEFLDATETVHDMEDRHCAQPPKYEMEQINDTRMPLISWNVSLTDLTDGTYSPLGASSQISNQTSTSCLASTVDDGGHGNGPNLGLRTG